MTLQPFMQLQPSQGWYLTSSPLITADWEADHDNRWTVPIGGQFGRIFKIGDQAINANLAAYYNVVTPDDTGANWQLRAEWTFLFSGMIGTRRPAVSRRRLSALAHGHDRSRLV